MSREFFKQITKLNITSIISGLKKSKLRVSIVLILSCLICIFGFTYKNAYGYTLGSKGSAVVPGTKSGDADIWPITHPVFTVQLYQSPNGMGTENGAYDKMADSIKTVIPYASEDAMWLCSNIASDYLIDHNFNTSTQVYLARKTSLASTKLVLKGGANNSDVTGRVKYLSKNEYKTFGNDINEGVFYNSLLKIFKANNYSMALMAKDKDF